MATASRDFQIFAKPIGAICNLDCHYCYYLKKEYLYPEGESFRMADDLLEEYIVQHIAASPTDRDISFAWHGGEPTLLGLDYYHKMVDLQKKHQPPGRQIRNGLQTNGVLLNDEWCRFFAAERFHIGLSLDGPQELHDAYRVNKGQQPTHKQVMRGYKLLRQHKVPCDLLCVVHAENVQHPIQVYRFFKDIKAEYLGLLPLVERQADAPGGVSERAVPAEALGTFLCTIFDEWVRNDVGRIIVQLFEEATLSAGGQEHALCIFRPTCGQVPVVEHNGDFYSCDHFVEPQHHLGNIRHIPLTQLLDSPQQQAFGEAKRDTLPRYCRECEVLAMCNGGCPKDRFITTPDGEPGLNYLCAGWKRFFTHSRPYVTLLAGLLRAGRPPQRLMEMVRAMDVPAPGRVERNVGRNDACPCGSGRKYKRCCLNA